MGDAVIGLCGRTRTITNLFKDSTLVEKSPFVTHRTVGTARVVMFLVDGRVQGRGEMHRSQVWQRARVVANRNLHDRVVVRTGMDAGKGEGASN